MKPNDTPTGHTLAGEEPEACKDSSGTADRGLHLKMVHAKMEILYAAAQWSDAFNLSEAHDQANSNEFHKFIDLCILDFEDTIRQHGCDKSEEVLVIALDRLVEPIFMWGARHFATLIRSHVDRKRKSARR